MSGGVIMNIEATSGKIMSAIQGDAFNREACEKILENFVLAISGNRAATGIASETERIALKRLLAAQTLQQKGAGNSNAAQPKPESWQEIAKGAAERFYGEPNPDFPLAKQFKREVLAAIERSHAAQPHPDSGHDLAPITVITAQPKPSKASPPTDDKPKRWKTDIDGYPISSQHENGGWMNEEQKASTESDAKASPLGEHSELGNHDCEYDSDGAPCNHCGKTASEAIIYFERNIRKQHSDQPPAKATVEWRVQNGPDGAYDLYTSDNHWVCSDQRKEKLERIRDAHNAALAAERRRREQAERDKRLAKRMEQAAFSKLLSALAAIENVRKREGCIVTDESLAKIIDEVDLSALREHDAEVREDQMQRDEAYWKDKLSTEVRKPPKDQATYERAVNMTLDAVMSVHDEHKGKMTWGELNAAVCARMKVKRTEPWERTKQ